MPAPITIDFTDTSLTSAVTQQVFVRQNWADAWAEQPTIWCNNVVWSLLPSTPVAELTREYGYVQEHGAAVWSTRNRVDLAGYYVKIVVTAADGATVWYGYIDEITDEQGGLAKNPADLLNPIPTGVQSWTCYGISTVLSHATQLRSRWNDVLTNPATPAQRWSGKAIDFNALPNRSATKFDSAYIFQPDGDDWSAADILEYMAVWGSPRDDNDVLKIPFEFVGLASLPPNSAPLVRADARSMLDIILDLINPSQLWQILVTVNEVPTVDVVQLNIRSLRDSALIDGAYTYPANDQFVSLQTSSPDTRISLRQSLSQIANRVVVRGGRRSSKFTSTIDTGDVGNPGSFVEDWESTDKDDYDEGDSLDAGYAAKSTPEKRSADAAQRNRSALRDVYTQFRLNYERMIAGDDTTPIFTDATGGQYIPYHDEILLKELPDVWFVVPNESIPMPAEMISRTGHEFSVDRTFAFDGDAFRLVADGAPQHVIAEDRFDPLAADDVILVHGVFRYRDATITASFSEDRYLQVQIPTTLPSVDVLRTRVINVDTTYNETICPETVRGFDSSGDPEFAFPVGDSTRTLERVALAAQWYLVPRKILQLDSPRISAIASVGQLVTTVNASTPLADTVNTVISEISISMPRGKDLPIQTARFTLKTATAEIDPLAFI